MIFIPEISSERVALMIAVRFANFSINHANFIPVKDRSKDGKLHKGSAQLSEASRNLSFLFFELGLLA